MYSNPAKIVIAWGVKLVVVCAILILASTITLAISNGSNAFVHNTDRVMQADKDIAIETDVVSSSRIPERSYEEWITDATITAKIKSKLWLSAYSDGSSTMVTTQAGKVTLTGSASSSIARNIAGWIATGTRGVVVLNNQLAVKT